MAVGKVCMNIFVAILTCMYVLLFFKVKLCHEIVDVVLSTIALINECCSDNYIIIIYNFPYTPFNWNWFLVR